MRKNIILNLSGVEIVFDTCKDAADFLHIAPSYFSKIFNDGKEHTVKQLKYRSYPSTNDVSIEEKYEWKRDKQGRISYINENVERFFETDPRYVGKFSINGKKLNYDGRDIDELTEIRIIDDVSKFFNRRIDSFYFIRRRILNVVNNSTK